MKFRQTNTTAVAAAKTAISTATAYRMEKDGGLPSQIRFHGNGAVPIRSPTFSTPRSCRYRGLRPASSRSPSSRRCCAVTPNWATPFAARSSVASDPGAPSMARSRRLSSGRCTGPAA